MLSRMPSFKIASIGGGVGGVIGSWASSEVYLLVNLFEKPVHNAVRPFCCFHFLFAILYSKVHLKAIYSTKGKNLLLRGAKSFLLE